MSFGIKTFLLFLEKRLRNSLGRLFSAIKHADAGSEWSHDTRQLLRELWDKFSFWTYHWFFILFFAFCGTRVFPIKQFFKYLLLLLLKKHKSTTPVLPISYFSLNKYAKQQCPTVVCAEGKFKKQGCVGFFKRWSYATFRHGLVH